MSRITLFIKGILLVTLIFSGCKKSSTGSDQISFKPLSYLPVYPGSHWIYIIGNDTLTSKTSDSLILFAGVYLTSLDNDLIWGYRKYCPYIVGGAPFIPILSETVGISFGEYFGDPRMYPGYKTTKVIAKTKDPQGDSIIIQRYIRYTAGPYPVPVDYYVYQTYKKNVGLCFECGIDTLTKDTTYKKVLISYFINRGTK